MTSILVTRPAAGRDPIVRLLESRGYRVHAVATLMIEPAGNEASVPAGCDWIVFTSMEGVNALRTLPRDARYAAVGEATANALRARGVEPSFVPGTSNGASLGAAMPDVEGKRVALVRAATAAPDLPEVLRRRGALVEEVTAYRTVEGPDSSREPIRTALADPDLAAVVFASGSAVRGFATLAGEVRPRAVTIGPRTSLVARELGFEVIAESASQDAESLAAAVAAAIPLKEKRHA